MGWLFGKKDDELYRGDPPASLPGFEGVSPSAYQGTPASRPYDPGSAGSPQPYPTVSSSYPTVSTPYPTVAEVEGVPYGEASPADPVEQPLSVPTGQPTGTDDPTDLAFASSQHRSISSVIRSLSTFFALIILVVAVGSAIMEKMVVGVDNPSSSARTAPDTPFEGVVGTAGDVTLANSSYEITIRSATAQPSAAWGTNFTSTSGGFLVVELSITRTDTSSSPDVLFWDDWKFTTDTDAPVEGLLAGGYKPSLSSLMLQPQESTTGLVVFDTLASAGTLSLTDFDGTWAQWQITATTPSVVTAELGVAVHPEIAQTPFTVTVAAPRWLGVGDPAAYFDPTSGSYLVLDIAATLDEGALGETSGLVIGYDNWQFTPNGGTAVTTDHLGVRGANTLSFDPGQVPTASTLLAFDVARSAGTLSLLNLDGSVLATWSIP